MVWLNELGIESQAAKANEHQSYATIATRTKAGIQAISPDLVLRGNAGRGTVCFLA